MLRKGHLSGLVEIVGVFFVVGVRVDGFYSNQDVFMLPHFVLNLLQSTRNIVERNAKSTFRSVLLTQVSSDFAPPPLTEAQTMCGLSDNTSFLLPLCSV